MHAYQYVLFDTQAAGGMPNGDHRQSQHPGQHTQQRMSQGGDMSAAHRQSEFNDPHGKILNNMFSIGHVNNNIPTIQLITGISRNTQSLMICLYDTHQHALLSNGDKYMYC